MRTPQFIILFAVILLLAVLMPVTASDDAISTVYKKDGTTVTGKIFKEHSDMIIIESEGKNLSVDKVDIVRIARDDNYLPMLTVGYELETAGKFGQALEHYHGILKKDPENKDAAASVDRMMQAIPYEFKRRNVLHYNAQRYDQLLNLIYNEVSGYAADSPVQTAMKKVESEVYTFMGQEKMKRMVYEQAEQDFRRALRLDKDNHTAALMLGDLFSAIGRWEDAYAILRDVSKNLPDNTIASGLLMQSALRTRNFEHGLQVYEALMRRENLPPQEQKFVTLCVDNSRELLDEARQHVAQLKSEGDNGTSTGTMTLKNEEADSEEEK